MFRTIKNAVRFFILGFFVGILCAPRAGAQTLRLLGQRIEHLWDDIVVLAITPVMALRREDAHEREA